MQNNKVTLDIGGKQQLITLKDRMHDNVDDKARASPWTTLRASLNMQVKILQLQTSDKGDIELIKELDSLNAPRGSRTITKQPATRMMQRMQSSPMKMKVSPGMGR